MTRRLGLRSRLGRPTAPASDPHAGGHSYRSMPESSSCDPRLFLAFGDHRPHPTSTVARVAGCARPVSARTAMTSTAMAVPRCELGDLPLDQGEHGRSAPKVASPRVLEVLPTQMAHYPSCTHKGDNPDFSRWGLITRDSATAWLALGNGEPVQADGGERPNLVATSRCQT